MTDARRSAKLRGGWGEALALDYLKGRGYKPVAMGYRTRFGEIDVIVGDKKTLVFVEVKTRKDDSHGAACEFVTPSKQQKIRTTAELYIAHTEDTRQPRFDIIEIYAPDGVKTKSPRIEHIINAF